MSNTVSLDFLSFRNDEDQASWDLPPWGHGVSQWALPLFVSADGHAFPIGTAFFIGRSIRFLVTAAHNITEALKREARLEHLLVRAELPEHIDLKTVNLWVLYQRPKDESSGIEFAFWPLESVDGAPPTDIVFGHPLFVEGYPTVSLPLGFSFPARGEKVWCVGYREFKFPEGGIPLDSVRTGAFDWQRDYSHRLTVVEGQVDSVYIQGFARGFVDGPCFTVNAEIFHAQSGGPVITERGVVLGINSAGASQYFGHPKSIISLLYPLLPVDLRFGASIGPVRISAKRSLLDLIDQGEIATDGSEIGMVLGQHDDGALVVYPPVPPVAEHIHDNYALSQQGIPAERSAPGEALVIRKATASE